MVHRQRVIHAVVGLHVHQRGEAQRHRLDAVVVDVGGLRQAGRSRGVDEDAAILDRQRHPLIVREGAIVDLGQDTVDTRQARNVAAMDPQRRLGRKQSPRLLPGSDMLGADNGHLRVDDRDRVGQRLAGQVGVDQGRCAAGAGNAEPDAQIVRAVVHQQGDDIALADALRAGPARVRIGAAVVVPVGQRLGVGDQRDLVGMLGRDLLHHVADGAGRRAGDRRDLPQDPQRAAQIGKLARQPLEQAHSRLSPGRFGSRPG